MFRKKPKDANRLEWNLQVSYSQHMQNTLFIISIIIAFIVLFTLLWVSISFLLSRLGGWANLAEQFPAICRGQGNVFNWHSARFNYFVNYSNCLTVIVSAAGIYLQPMIFLRMGHKPIMVPWDAITVLERRYFFVFVTTKLKIKVHDDNKLITIILYGKRLADDLAEQFEHQKP
jgi:hypothetical protein